MENVAQNERNGRFRGEFSLSVLGDVAYASRQMLSSVCDENLPAVALARQDILTFGQPEIGALD